ncbi:hypothetical protein [Streptomyces sp. NBC_01262]|uniref:hypothetical protein n=1 Tax=Streptomyces sp. NBC_01262 TaxID=2903803 RepID=UPI002E2FC727|nr:hypothetical protein [Streptomyces sp. NBC_01262]
MDRCVILIPEDELRPTGWMHRHHTLTWAEPPAPGPVESKLISELRPPLNLSGAEPDEVHNQVKAGLTTPPMLPQNLNGRGKHQLRALTGIHG